MQTTHYSKLYSKFLDDKDIACRIYDMLANDILGKEQLEKIKLRYDDMYRNFFNYSKEEAGKLIKSGREACVWEFSKGVEPFTPKGWNRYYEDTITVPIPITHPDFKDLTTRTEKRGAIGLDLPTWFNMKNNDKRIKVGGIKRMEVAEWHCLLKNLLNTVMAFTLPTAENILYMTIRNPPITLKKRKTYTRPFCKKR